MLGELKGEVVFLDDLFIAPAPGTVELRDQRFSLFDTHLVNTVFVTVERRGAAVAAVSQAFDGVHDEARRQVVEGVRRLVHKVLRGGHYGCGAVTIAPFRGGTKRTEEG